MDNIKTAKGEITAITMRKVTTKYGEKDAFSLKINDEIKNEELYMSGFGECPYKEGEVIELKYTVVQKDGRVFNNIYKPKAQGDNSEVMAALKEIKSDIDILATQIDFIRSTQLTIARRIKIEDEELHNYQQEKK
jgi:hypothetical protein